MNFRRVSVLGFLSIAVSSGALGAQEVTCEDIEFDDEARARYSQIDEACLGISDTGSARYVRLHAIVMEPGAAYMDVRFEHQDGSWGPTIRVHPDQDFRVLVDGEATPWHMLEADQELNVYLKEGRWEVAMTDYDEPEIVEEYVAPMPASATEELAVQEEPEVEAPAEEEPAAAEPADSSSRRWLWIGLLLILVIGIVMMRRRKSGGST